MNHGILYLKQIEDCISIILQLKKKLRKKNKRMAEILPHRCFNLFSHKLRNGPLHCTEEEHLSLTCGPQTAAREDKNNIVSFHMLTPVTWSASLEIQVAKDSENNSKCHLQIQQVEQPELMNSMYWHLSMTTPAGKRCGTSYIRCFSTSNSVLFKAGFSLLLLWSHPLWHKPLPNAASNFPHK